MNFLRSFVQSFMEKRLLLKAAALSYTSLLTLLPLVAITFTVTNFLIMSVDPDQIDELLELILTHIVPQVELLDPAVGGVPANGTLTKVEIIEGIKNIISQIGSGQVGLVGASIFLFLAFSLLLTIEHSLNDIWNVSYGRNLPTRILLYLFILVIGSLLYLLAIFYTSRWQGSLLARTIQHVPFLSRALQFVLPFVFCWMALCFLYFVLPNTRIALIPGLIGGIVSGTFLQLNNVLSFLYLLNVATATRLYGKLGILPIMLGGLYISWLIVLAGAQFTKTLEERMEDPSGVH